MDNKLNIYSESLAVGRRNRFLQEDAPRVSLDEEIGQSVVAAAATTADEIVSDVGLK